MPTNRKRTKRAPAAPIRQDFLDYLMFGTEPENRGFDFFLFKSSLDRQQQIWTENRKALMSAWSREYLCKRPYFWWIAEGVEPRGMVGGSGIQAQAAGNYKQHYFFGVPIYWTQVDESNPPLFESQATYLQDRGYLRSREKKYLNSHPELLEPESVYKIIEPRMVLDVSKFK